MTSQIDIVTFGTRALSPQQIGHLSTLHAELLPHSPVVLMGEEFMQKFFYRSLIDDQQICGALAYAGKVPAGFIVATHNPASFMPATVRKHMWRCAITIFLSVLRRPARLGAMWEAYSIQRNIGQQRYPTGMGELLSFGVLPQFLGREFVKETGVRVGVALIDSAMQELAVRDVKTVRAVVDQDNIQAQLFYRSIGWRVGASSVPGWKVPTMEFLYDIEPMAPTKRE